MGKYRRQFNETEIFWFVVLLIIVVATLIGLILQTPDADAADLDLDNGLEFGGQVRGNDLDGRERNVTIYTNEDDEGSEAKDLNITHGGAVTHAEVGPGEEAIVVTFPGGGASAQPVIIIRPKR